MRVVRKKLGLGQEDLADVLGYSRVHMSRIENGHSSMSIENINEWVEKINTHFKKEIVSLFDFIADDQQLDSLVRNSEERNLLAKRRGLEEDEQKAFDAMTATILDTIKTMKKK